VQRSAVQNQISAKEYILVRSVKLVRDSEIMLISKTVGIIVMIIASKQ